MKKCDFARQYIQVPRTYAMPVQRAKCTASYYWFPMVRQNSYDPDDEELCDRIFRAAKQADHTLTEGELEALCRA